MIHSFVLVQFRIANTLCSTSILVIAKDADTVNTVTLAFKTKKHALDSAYFLLA